MIHAHVSRHSVTQSMGWNALASHRKLEHRRQLHPRKDRHHQGAGVMLETVHYIDEDPVTYRDWRDRALLETMKYALGLTIREVYPMLQKMLIDGLDPIVAGGDVVEWCGLLEVPASNTRVNLIEAREECGRQIKTCQMLLEGEVDRAEAVLRNSIEWCRFWSVRAPTPELREMFANSLRRLLEGPTAMEMEDG